MPALPDDVTAAEGLDCSAGVFYLFYDFGPFVYRGLTGGVIIVIVTGYLFSNLSVLSCSILPLCLKCKTLRSVRVYRGDPYGSYLYFSTGCTLYSIPAPDSSAESTVMLGDIPHNHTSIVAPCAQQFRGAFDFPCWPLWTLRAHATWDLPLLTSEDVLLVSALRNVGRCRVSSLLPQHASVYVIASRRSCW